MKYIVEFEDEPCMYEDDVHFYKCVQAPWWGLSERVIEQLTPYQPDHTADVSKKVERTDEIAQNVSDSDLVSRKAAIEAIEKAKTAQTPDGELYVAKINAEMNIQLLPTVQPVLTCKGCRYDGYYKHMQCRNCLRKERDLYEPE